MTIANEAMARMNAAPDPQNILCRKRMDKPSKASVGDRITVIAAADIDFFRAADKYTVVAWRDEAGQPREAVIRTPLKELLPQLDEARFVQVHRSVVYETAALAAC